jgi:polyhydroxyalkanoate synthase
MTSHPPKTPRATALDLTAGGAVESVVETMQQRLDPFGVMTSLANAQAAWQLHPLELSRALHAIAQDAVTLQGHLARRALGLPSEDVVRVNREDARFADPAWTEQPGWDLIKETYLAITHRLEDMLYDTPGLSDKERRRAAFWLREWLNAMAPTNFLATNPVAQRKLVESKGQSLVQGVQNLLRDAKAKNVQMVERDAFKVGVDLATTPGHVVLRNRLVEVLHYTPTTAKVHQTPIVLVTAWINKFYVLDMTAHKSLVKYLTDQGYSVFITGWKNPTQDMADVRFDDYLTEGVDATVAIARKICKSPQVHLAGYCIGGTLVATYMAWANRHYGAAKMPVAHWTLLTSLTDFSQPGDIEVFLDEPAVAGLEEKMAKTGFLTGEDMATAFRLLRSNSLIWHYFEKSYLFGEPLPPFDILYWNIDTTRMPAAMHSYYLRQMYLHNNLVKPDALTLAGEAIDLGRITQPLYAVGAQEDHIVPWRQAFKVREFIDAETPVRFVLSTSGHILGIVNPVVDPPKRSYWVGTPAPIDHADHWLEQADKYRGSWWADWLAWLHPQCGPMVAAPKVGARGYPDLGPAPGTYVLEP